MKTSLCSLTAAVLLVVGSAAHATSIGANFVGRDSAGNNNVYTLAAGDTAGVVPQANWNNVINGNVNNGTTGVLNDNTGAATAVTLQFSSNDSWNSDGGTSNPNEVLMKGIIKVQGLGNSVVLTFHNVPTGSYEVIATTATNGAGSNLDVNVGATTYYITETNAFDGTFTQGTSTDANNRTPNVDYVRFGNVSPTGGDITLTATWRGGTDGGSLTSIQLVPEPSSLVLCGLGAVGLFFVARRRKAYPAATAASTNDRCMSDVSSKPSW